MERVKQLSAKDKLRLRSAQVKAERLGAARWQKEVELMNAVQEVIAAEQELKELAAALTPENCFITEDLRVYRK